MAVKFDFKSFLVNHSEKLVGGLALLLGLWGFAAATWKSTELTLTPAELSQHADNVRKDIEGNTTWPEEEENAFLAIDDVQQLANELGRKDELNYQNFEHQVVWLDPLYPLREKRSRVTVLAPITPEVSGISVAIAFPPDEEEEDPNTSAKETEPEVPVDEGRRKASDEFGGTAAQSRQGTSGIGQSANVALALGIGGGLMRFGGRRDEDEDEDENYRGRSGLRGPASSILATAEKKVEWRAGISVRMIVSLRNQRQELAKALHIKGVQNTQSHVDYQQMHIERQEFRYGEWSEWEILRLDDVGEILAESLGQDIDIVSSAVTRDGITMPLPRRGAGRWQDHQASHQKLINFTLDEDEQQMMNQILAVMASDAEEARRGQPAPRKSRRGFSEFTQSAFDLRRQIGSRFGTEKSFRDSVKKRITESMAGKDGKLGDRQGQLFSSQFDQINGTDEQQAMADERLLLVRFFDFTADRGITYRYRVRLEMYNPNYQWPVDELESPELASSETIFSDWSDATDAATVPMRYRNHVRKVKVRGAQRRVDVGVYYESNGVLPVMETISVDVGMPIGGQKRTDRVDLEKSILEGGDVDFSTNELLNGVAFAGGLNTKDHTDLKGVLSKFGRNNRPVDDLISVIDSAGSIVLKYATESSSLLRNDEETVKNILVNYEDWREGDAAEESQFFDDDDDDDDDGDGSGRRGRGMKTGSALGRFNGGSGKSKNGRGKR
jgi:hypothetical protein